MQRRGRGYRSVGYDDAVHQTHLTSNTEFATPVSSAIHGRGNASVERGRPPHMSRYAAYASLCKQRSPGSVDKEESDRGDAKATVREVETNQKPNLLAQVVQRLENEQKEEVKKHPPAGGQQQAIEQHMEQQQSGIGIDVRAPELPQNCPHCHNCRMIMVEFGECGKVLRELCQKLENIARLGELRDDDDQQKN